MAFHLIKYERGRQSCHITYSGRRPFLGPSTTEPAESNHSRPKIEEIQQNRNVKSFLTGRGTVGPHISTKFCPRIMGFSAAKRRLFIAHIFPFGLKKGFWYHHDEARKIYATILSFVFPLSGGSKCRQITRLGCQQRKLHIRHII